MGYWTVNVTKPQWQVINDPGYGTTFPVRFNLTYHQSKFGSFKEMPTLEWKETITLIDRHANTYWQYVVDQYERLPDSMTLRTWPNRYANLYDSVWYQLIGNQHPTVLKAKRGQPLAKHTFGPRPIGNAGQKATAVREYLKRNGGQCEIEIIDRPSILRPQNGGVVKKERILTFDCGLRGLGPRVRGYQHVKIDSDRPESEWVRTVEYSTITPPFSLDGLTRVPPPQSVTRTERRPTSVAEGYYP